MINSDQKVVEYIKDAKAHSKSKEDIYKELLVQGFSLQVIQDSFLFIEKDISKEETSKKTISIVVTFGAILISAGIFSFIASNWIYMSKVYKVMVILFFMLLSYSLGWNLIGKLKLLQTGGAFIILGNIIFGSGLFLVGQIFNIRMFWANGFLLWLLGTLLLAVVLEYFPLFILAISIGIGAAVSSSFSMDFMNNIASTNIVSVLLLLGAFLSMFVLGKKIRRNMPEEFKEFY